jgi:hypothetical protein
VSHQDTPLPGGVTAILLTSASDVRTHWGRVRGSPWRMPYTNTYSATVLSGLQSIPQHSPVSQGQGSCPSHASCMLIPLSTRCQAISPLRVLPKCLKERMPACRENRSRVALRGRASSLFIGRAPLSGACARTRRRSGWAPRLRAEGGARRARYLHRGWRRGRHVRAALRHDQARAALVGAVGPDARHSMLTIRRRWRSGAGLGPGRGVACWRVIH